MSSNIPIVNFLPDSNSSYGYRPTEWVTITFISLFGISTILHACQAIYKKAWFMFPTAVLAGALEVTGWSARLWSSINLFNFAPFQMQIVCTIIAPTPLVAANFIVLGQIIQLLGPKYSRLQPKWYTILFCGFDIVSLIVQGVGGGLASSEANGGNPDKGGNIMLGGIAFQLASITVYALTAGEFLIRYWKDKPYRQVSSVESGQYSARGLLTPNVKVVIAALTFNTLCLFIRAIYRTIELANGWSGRIITTQVYFNVLDGAMIVLAIYTLNIVHPPTFLPSTSTTQRDLEMEKLHQGGSLSVASSDNHS